MDIGLGQQIAPTDPTDLNTAITSAANQYNVDPAYLSRVAQIESGGNPNATSSTGARGPFQFTGGTAKQYGLTDPTDVSQSANAAARLTADNQAALTKALGRAPTSGELYLAHQQGANGAIALITHPNMSAADALTPVYGGNAARATQALTVNGGTPDMTAGAFANKWASKFAPQGNNASPGNNGASPGNGVWATTPPPGTDATPGAPLSLSKTAAAPTAAQDASKLAQAKMSFVTGIGNKVNSAFTTGIGAPSPMQLSDTPVGMGSLWQSQAG